MAEAVTCAASLPRCILVVVLAGLGAYIYFVDSKRPAASADGSSETKEKVFTVEADKINELRITYQGESSLLKKSDAGWKMFEPAQIDADPPEAIGVATALTNVEIVRVVDENATDLEQFGLANPQITVAFKADGGASGTLKLGNKNATQGEIYAREGRREERVPGVVVPGDQLQPQAVRPARQEDPEVRSRQGGFAGR